MRRDLQGEIPDPVLPVGVQNRKMEDSDARAAHDVLARGFWQGGGGAPNFRAWWSQLRKDSEYDPALCLVAVDGKDVVGMAQCWTSAFVKDIAVHPRARRLGIGRALMLAVSRIFEARGAPHVDLKVREENAPAIALYRSLDMSIVAREPA
jgi:ribosomal protein S18 acetylase RimI-like enzyme